MAGPKNSHSTFLLLLLLLLLLPCLVMQKKLKSPLVGASECVRVLEKNPYEKPLCDYLRAFEIKENTVYTNAGSSLESPARDPFNVIANREST